MATYIQQIAMRLRMTGSEPVAPSLITPVKPIYFPFTLNATDYQNPSIHDPYPNSRSQQVLHSQHHTTPQNASQQQSTGATKGSDTNRSPGYVQTILQRPVHIVNQTFTSRQLTSLQGPEINITKELLPSSAADAVEESVSTMEPVKKEVLTFHIDHFHNVAGNVQENESRMIPALIGDNTYRDQYRMQPAVAPPIINLPKENKLVIGKISVEILPATPAPMKTTERIITRVVSAHGNRSEERSRLSYGFKQY